MKKKLFRYLKPGTHIVSGRAAPTRSAQTILSILCLVFLVAGFSGLGPGATAHGQTDEVLFQTPEDAITFYVQAVAQADVAQIMQVCAVDEMGEKFRFDLFTNRLRALTMTSPAPSDYAFYAEMNKAQFAWQILNQVKNLAYGLLATEKGATEGRTVMIDEEGTAQFMAEVNPERLAPLQVVEIGVPVPDIAYSERNQNNWNTQAQIYGADEFTERVALLLFEGNYYYVGFTLLRYGDAWKISSAASPLGNTSFSGAPQAITAADFQALISGE